MTKNYEIKTMHLALRKPRCTTFIFFQKFQIVGVVWNLNEFDWTLGEFDFKLNKSIWAILLFEIQVERKHLSCNCFEIIVTWQAWNKVWDLVWNSIGNNPIGRHPMENNTKGYDAWCKLYLNKQHYILMEVFMIGNLQRCARWNPE